MLDTSARLVSGLNQQLGDAQFEFTRQRSELEGLRKKLEDIEASKKKDLEDAEQRGYDS